MKSPTIRVISDLHLEFGPFNLPVLESEVRSILVLAGDIGIASKPSTYIPFLGEVSKRFREVIYLCGNHEHYHGSIVRSIPKIKRTLTKELGDDHNINVVDNEIVRIDDVSFVCSTMWTSYDNGNPMTLLDADRMMNDHRLIRTGPYGEPYKTRFRARDAHAEFFKAKNFIFPTIKAEKKTGRKVCVITHHAPSLQSIHERYRSGNATKVNGAYASDLDDLVLEAAPELWCHGHVHDSFDYMIGETHVVVNPRGYFGHEENIAFNPELILTLD